MSNNDNNGIDVDNDICHPYRSKPLKIQCLVLGSTGCGKTSILRRYFQRMENYNSHPQHPTMGAFYYSQRVSNPLYRHSSTKQNFSEQEEHKKRDEVSVSSCSKSKKNKKNKKRTKKRTKKHLQRDKQQTSDSNYSCNDILSKVTISQQQHVHLHMWDTAGFKTQFLLLDNNKDDTVILTKSLGDSIFRYANVAMLVYDATSSRSFTQLLRWYSELQARLKIHHVSKTSTKNHPPRFPILIVANKMDLVKKKQRETIDADTNAKSLLSTTTTTNDQNKTESNTNESLKYIDHYSSVTNRNIPIVPQRNVLGFQHKKNYQSYEFSSGCDSNSSSLTFLGLQRTSWVSYFLNEGDYLQCLLNAEDTSFPGEDMVLSWCQKQQLTHIEVSALDGTNIDLAVETMIKLSLEYSSKIQNDQYISTSGIKYDRDKAKNLCDSPYRSFSLHRRYKKKEECNIFKCLHPWCQ